MYELKSALELRNLLLEVLRGSESNPTFPLVFIHCRMDSERCSAFLNVPLPADVVFPTDLARPLSVTFNEFV